MTEFTEKNRKTIVEILAKLEEEKKTWTEAKLKAASATDKEDYQIQKCVYSKAHGFIEALYWVLGKQITRDEWKKMMWNRPIKKIWQLYLTKNQNARILKVENQEITKDEKKEN